MNYMDQRVSSTTGPSSRRSQDSWRTESNEERSRGYSPRRRHSRSPRRRSRSPRDTYYHRSRSPRDPYSHRSRSPQDRNYSRPGPSRRSPSPRSRLNSRPERFERRSPSPIERYGFQFSRPGPSHRTPSPVSNYSRGIRDIHPKLTPPSISNLVRRDNEFRGNSFQQGGDYCGSNQYRTDEEFRRNEIDLNLGEDFDIMSRENGYTKWLHPIPEHCVGLVIGKGGSEIHSISEKSGCRVVVNLDHITAEGYRNVEINGHRDKIQAAIDLIDEAVARAGTPRKPSEREQHFGENQQISIEIPIPANKCGSIIGKGGETMKRLRSFSQCQINLIQDTNVADTDKPLRIIGTRKCVEHARQLVLDLLEHGEEGPTLLVPDDGKMLVTLHVHVPRPAVGTLMGHNGERIKQLSDKSQTKCQFLEDMDPNLMTRTLSIFGPKNKVHVTSELVKQIVSSEDGTIIQPLSLFYLSIPSSKCGLVIGHRGDIIKQINNQSGAHCELSRDFQDDPTEKTFIIRGTDEQVEHAKHLIAIKVGDLPPNTPFDRSVYQQQRIQTQYQNPGQPLIQQHHPMQHPQGMQQQQPNMQNWTGHPIIQQQPHQSPPMSQPGQPNLVRPPNYPAQSALPLIQPHTIAAWQQFQASHQQKQQLIQQQKHQLMQQHNMLPPQQLPQQLPQQPQQMQQPMQQQMQPQMQPPQQMQQQIMQQQQMMQQQQIQQRQMQQHQIHQQVQQQQMRNTQQFQQQQQMQQQQQQMQQRPQQQQQPLHLQFQQQHISPRPLFQQSPVAPQQSAPYAYPQQQRSQTSPQKTQSAQHQQPQQARVVAPAQLPVAHDPSSGLSLYAQYSLQAAAELKAAQEAAARKSSGAPKASTAPKASAAPKVVERTPEPASEEERDYSQQWYEYYLSINDQDGAELVRRKIEENKAEKARKAAGASTSQNK